MNAHYMSNIVKYSWQHKLVSQCYIKRQYSFLSLCHGIAYPTEEQFINNCSGSTKEKSRTVYKNMDTGFAKSQMNGK